MKKQLKMNNSQKTLRTPQIDSLNVNASTLAHILGLSNGRITQLVQDDGLPRETDKTFNVVKCVSWYVAWLRNHTSDAESVARVRGLEAKASLSEIELAKQQQSLITIEDATLIIAGGFSAIRSQVLAIPAKVAPQVVGLTAPEIEGVLKTFVHELLVELSTIPERLKQLEVPPSEDSE